MANFSPSNLLTAQALLADRFKSAESRLKLSPVLSLGLGNQDILIPNHLELRKRADRAVEAYVLKRSKRATTSTKTHNHTGNRGDSFAMPLSWSRFTDVFSISMEQLENNMFEFNQVLAQQLQNAMQNVLVDAEEAAVASLFANRTQINAATAGGTFNATDDVFEITEQTRFYQIVQSMMRANDYRGVYDVITNQNAFINAQYAAAQGGGNSANLSFQFQNLNIAESNDLAHAGYTEDIALVMPQGSFACLPWIDQKNRSGYGDYMSYNGGKGSMRDPFGLGIDFAIHGYSQRADASASNGTTQDLVMEFEISIDMAFPISPLSASTESVVFEAALV